MRKCSHDLSVRGGMHCLPQATFIVFSKVKLSAIHCSIVTSKYRSLQLLATYSYRELRLSGLNKVGGTGRVTKRGEAVPIFEHRHEDGTSAHRPPEFFVFPSRDVRVCCMPCAHRIFSARISTSSCRIFSASGTNGGGFIPAGSRVGGFSRQ